MPYVPLPVNLDIVGHRVCFVSPDTSFDTEPVSTYENSFSMSPNNRFNLFCRGVNKLLGEMTNHKHIQNLSYDTSIAIAYPLLRFFIQFKKNREAIDRVYRGLLLAYEDSSLQKLWKKEYMKSVQFAHLQNRNFFISKIRTQKILTVISPDISWIYLLKQQKNNRILSL